MSKKSTEFPGKVPMDTIVSQDKMLGDEVEEILQQFGAHRLAKAYEEVTNVDCGCESRKKWLNNMHRKLKEWWNDEKRWWKN